MQTIRRERGVSLVEYAILASLVVTALIAITARLEERAQVRFTEMATDIGTDDLDGYTPVDPGTPDGGDGGDDGDDGTPDDDDDGGDGDDGDDGDDGSGGPDTPPTTSPPAPTTTAAPTTTTTRPPTTTTTTLSVANEVSTSGSGSGQTWNNSSKKGTWKASVTFDNTSSQPLVLTIQVAQVRADGQTTTSSATVTIPAGGSTTYDVGNLPYSRNTKHGDVRQVRVTVTGGVTGTVPTVTVDAPRTP